MGTAPTAQDRAMRIVTAFQLADDDNELGGELFDVVEALVADCLAAKTEDELEDARMGIANTMIVLCALIDGLIDHCPKDVQLFGLAQQLTGSLA